MVPAIETVTADDRAAMDAWYALTMRCHAHDAPELPALSRPRHDNRLSSPGFARRAWLVRDGAEVVAAAEVSLPLHDNLDNGFAHVLVDPAHRRRGLGSRLLTHLAADAAADGRRRLLLGADERLDAPGAGSAFLRAAGARLGMRELQRRLALPPADTQALRDLAATAREATRAYRLVQWTGPTPPGRCADLAVLRARMSTDSPHGDFDLAPQHWDAERIRERDAAVAASGERMVVTAAQADDDRLVAYTEIAVPTSGDGHVARQDDTVVLAEHRGRRLGLRVKLANLELLAREHPQVRAVDTYNADDNRWMIAVNEAMGFVPIRRIEDWELDVAPAQAGTTPAISAAASGP